MKKGFLLFVFLVLLTACSQEEKPVIKKINAPSGDSEKNPVLVEKQSEKEDEKETLLEFSLPEEQIIVNLDRVPILEEYLAGIPNPKAEIQQMKLDRVVMKNKDSIYLLQFSCHNGLCSHLLFDQSKEDSAFLLADLAALNDIIVSPDETKIALHFSRQLGEKGTPTLDKLIVMDLENWVIAPLETETTEISLDYQFPIIHANWTDNQSLTIDIPDIPEPSREDALLQWQNTNKNTKKVDFQVKSK
jgi:hypothetical protein